MGRSGFIRNWLADHVASAGFYLYALVLAPVLARLLKAGLAGAEPLWLPGAILLAVFLFEPFGLRWKLQFLRRRNRESGFVPEGSLLGLISAVAIGHMILTVVAGLLMLDCWGVIGAGAEAESRWLGLTVVVLVLKEFVALLGAGGQSLAAQPPGHWKERLADFLLVAFGCVIYTAWWAVLLDLGEVAGESLGMKLALLPFLGGLFAFLYLPLRLPFLLDECYLRPARGRRGRILLELGLGLLLGFYPVLRG